jgi:methionyl-tRNA formyltransferase
MRVIFMGTPDFAVPCLDAIVAAGHELIAVVAQPDKPKGRGQALQSPPVVERARALGLPARQPKAVRSGPFVQWMTAEAQADVAVVVAYGRILMPALLAAPKRGCLNVHASLLPRHRGAAPIQRAIMAGDRETGVCVMQMEEGLDTGPVLLRKSTPLPLDESGPALWARLSQLGAQAIVEALDQLDVLQAIPQDHAAATLAPPLSRADGLLRWAEPALALHDRVRGVDPWPGAQARLRGAPLKVWQTWPLPDHAHDQPPGTIVEAGPRLLVATGAGALELRVAQLPGKPRRSAAELINGARLSVGERVEDGALDADPA